MYSPGTSGGFEPNRRLMAFQSSSQFTDEPTMVWIRIRRGDKSVCDALDESLDRKQKPVPQEPFLWFC